MKRAVVVSGGSIKISWEGGAIAEVLGSGFEPDIITGTSAGALCVAHLAAHQHLGWPVAGEALAAFIAERVTSPDVVGTKRGLLELGWRWWRKRWEGIINTDRLDRLVRDTLGHAFPITGGVQARVCSVDLRSGDKVYTGADEAHFLDAVLASTAEPVVMPTRWVQGSRHVDGGIREITPLAEAIRLGADQIVCVVARPAKVARSNGNWGDLCPLVGRLTTLGSNEIVENDLARCHDVNDLVAAGLRPGKRHIEVTVIRPERELPIALDSFTSADIRKMIQRGREDAARVLGERGLARAA